MNKRKIRTFLRTTALVAAIVLVGICMIFNQHKGTQITNNHETEILLNWVKDGEGVCNFPLSFDGVSGETFSFSSKLPETLPDRSALSFYSLFSNTEIYIDNNLFYSYVSTKEGPINKLLGDVRLVVSIPEEYAGKNIKIVQTPVYNQKIMVPQIVLGCRSDLIMDIIYQNTFLVIVFSVLFTLVLMSGFLAFYHIAGHHLENAALFGNFTLFVFIAATWIFCDSDIPQFFTDKNEAVSMASYLAISIFPMPFAGFSKRLLKRGQKWFEFIETFGWLIPLLNMTGYLLNLFDPPEVLAISHVMIVVSAVVTFVFSIREWKESTTSKMMIVAMFVLILTSIGGIVSYYKAPPTSLAPTVFCVGFIIFIGFLLSALFHRMITYTDEREFLDRYKELAYKDYMTGLGNRALFNRSFSEIKERGEIVTVLLFLMDLNYLKVLNDRYGHEAGDKVIIGLSDCIKKVFNPYGRTFRINGDEFAALIINPSLSPDEYLKIFDDCISGYNENHTNKLSVAVGFAKNVYNGTEEFSRILYREADQVMYDDKQRKHSEGI